jgi:hypothetical protein
VSYFLVSFLQYRRKRVARGTPCGGKVETNDLLLLTTTLHTAVELREDFISGLLLKVSFCVLCK